MDNYIFKYYQSIKDGSIVTSRWVILLYEQIVKGMEDGTYKFVAKKANKAIKWIEKYCHHTEGELAPGKLKLELWQKAMLSVMFGICDPKTGKRQFREVALIVARKNGKSLFAAAIANYIFFEDGGYGARVYCLAPKLDQAEIIYNDIWAMISLEPELCYNKKLKEDEQLPNVAKHRMTDLYIKDTNSTAKKIAFSSKKSDGFNPSITICDEIASWQGDAGLKQYEVMKSGMGARPEGFLLSCSTSGYINDSIYDEIIKRGTRFLLGESKETRLLPIFYIIDDVEKWNDINELRKSNPNLGVSVTVDYLLEEIAVAEGSLSKKAEFLTKYCNIKQNSSMAWLDTKTINKCIGSPLKLEDFSGSYCVGGIDLSRTTDLTACTVAIEKDERIYVFTQFFMPAEKIEEATARDGLPYRMYIQRGFLKESGENFVDYNDCFDWFKMLVEKYEILPLKVGYDRYSALQLVQSMKEYGFQMDDVYQGENLSPVIDETEGMMKDGRICIGDNDLMKVHLLDSALKQNAETSRKRLVKVGSTVHIDGTAALLDAMCVRQKWFTEIGEQITNR